MPTVEDVARDVLNSIDTSAGLLQASLWVADRYKRLAARVKMKHLRRVSAVFTSGTITAGVATATTLSNIITGDAAAQAAWTSADLTGKYFRLAVAWYQVVGVNVVAGAPQLQLETPWAELTAQGAPGV